jgi:uncharacterized protein YkwD
LTQVDPVVACAAVLKDVLALHNQLRAKNSAPPLTWSASLEQSAMAWAKGCDHEHSTNRAGNYNELNAWGNRPFTQAVQDQWYAGESVVKPLRTSLRICRASRSS